LWELFFLAAIFVEFALVPFTCCLDIEQILDSTKRIEMGVDVVWSANILISANVSYKDALGIPVTSFPKILKHYMW